jgi:hypothetical protein
LKTTEKRGKHRTSRALLKRQRSVLLSFDIGFSRVSLHCMLFFTVLGYMIAFEAYRSGRAVPERRITVVPCTHEQPVRRHPRHSGA